MAESIRDEIQKALGLHARWSPELESDLLALFERKLAEARDLAPGESFADWIRYRKDAFPGEAIVEVNCTCCGAQLCVEYGTDEGTLAVVGTPAPKPPPSEPSEVDGPAYRLATAIMHSGSNDQKLVTAVHDWLHAEVEVARVRARREAEGGSGG